jgi:pyrroloquinoline quinone (PQQ) biosynthesis protein C
MRQKLNLKIQEVEEIMLASPWENREFYADFLAQTYYYVSHSTRLLALAISYFQIDRDQLHNRFAAHIAEEKAHERLALNDIKKLGFELSRFPQLGHTRAFYESQYYKIERQEATSLLGYIVLLEEVSVQIGPKIYKRVSEAYGKQAASFLRVHVEEDPGHVEQAMSLIANLPLAQQDFVWINVNQTADIYMSIVQQINEKQNFGLRPAA